MAYSAKVGSFNIDTSVTVGNTQSITDVGFQPKIVLFWWSGSTATGEEVAGGNINIGFGAGISSSSRFCTMAISEDGQGDADTSYSIQNAEVIRCYIDTDTIDGIADFESLDADGFTLKIDDQFTQSYRISYLALGGDDLTNVSIGSYQLPASTGEFSIDGIGFQPDAVILAANYSVSASTTGINLFFELGWATGSSNQGVIGAYSQDAQATTFTKGYGYNGECSARVASSTSSRLSFVAFGSDGFTLNRLETTTRYYLNYIAIKGGQYLVGDLTTRTDGNDIAETIGFQPSALLFGSANRELSTQDTTTPNSRLSIGAATSTSNRAVQAISDEDNLADSETAHANYDSAVYANVVDDATVGLMDLKSIESDGFTCVMDDADPSECWVTYLAIGATEEDGGCVNVVTQPVVVVEFCEE